MAAVLVLEPIFEADLQPEQYAYRRDRSALDAVRHVHKLINTGHGEIVDADLSSYFDTLPHSELLKSVARRVVDGAMLHLIKMWLEAPVEETDERGNKRRSTRNRDEGRGTPQGSPISPLLSNLYMRRFVLGWKKLGHEKRLKAYIVNYADDLVICCRNRAEEALVTMRNMMSKLKLTVNEKKTRVCKLPEEKFDFLRVYVRAMLLAEDGTSLSRHDSVEETGATHLCRDQPGNRTEQDPAGPRNSNHDTQSNDDRVGQLFLSGASQSMPIERSNDMLARGYDSGCAPSTSCEGRQPNSFQSLPCIRCWALSSLLLGQAAFRGRNREPFSESRMREMRLSGSMSGNRKQSHAKPD